MNYISNNPALNNPYYFQNAPDWGSNQVAGYGDSNIEGTDFNTGGGNNWFSEQNYGQGVASGLAAGASSSQPVGDFEIDKWAGYKGSGQGLAGGGAIGAITGGVTAQLGTFSGVNKNLRNLNTSVDGVTYDAYGRPSYNGQAVVDANANINALNQGEKAITSSWDPATRGFSGAFGTRRKIRRKRSELQNNIRTAQAGFNEAELSHRNQFNQRQSYLDNLNDQSRLYNLHRFRS